MKLTLPTEPSETSGTIDDYHFFIHGEKKIGKSTFAMAEPDVLLLTFDPIRKSYPFMQRYCPNWTTLVGYINLLEAEAKAGTYRYKRVVVDGADIWYRYCQVYAEKKLGVEHVSDAGWGKGWDLLKAEATFAAIRLMALPGGCWWISHSNWQEVKTRDGRKIVKLLPLIKAGAEEVLIGRVDGWFAYDYQGSDRIMIIAGDESTGAGHNCKKHFVTTDGRPVIEVYMGTDEHEAWENFKSAFHNQQKYSLWSEMKGGTPAKPAISVPAAARPGSPLAAKTTLSRPAFAVKKPS